MSDVKAGYPSAIAPSASSMIREVTVSIEPVVRWPLYDLTIPEIEAKLRAIDSGDMSGLDHCYPHDAEGLRLLIGNEIPYEPKIDLWTLPTEDLLAFVRADDDHSAYNGFFRDMQAALTEMIKESHLYVIEMKRAWLRIDSQLSTRPMDLDVPTPETSGARG